jgi:hypothetical protein
MYGSYRMRGRFAHVAGKPKRNAIHFLVKRNLHFAARGSVTLHT